MCGLLYQSNIYSYIVQKKNIASLSMILEMQYQWLHQYSTRAFLGDSHKNHNQEKRLQTNNYKGVFKLYHTN